MNCGAVRREMGEDIALAPWTYLQCQCSPYRIRLLAACVYYIAEEEEKKEQMTKQKIVR